MFVLLKRKYLVMKLAPRSSSVNVTQMDIGCRNSKTNKDATNDVSLQDYDLPKSVVIKTSQSIWHFLSKYSVVIFSEVTVILTKTKKYDMTSIKNTLLARK